MSSLLNLGRHGSDGKAGVYSPSARYLVRFLRTYHEGILIFTGHVFLTFQIWSHTSPYQFCCIIHVAPAILIRFKSCVFGSDT